MALIIYPTADYDSFVSVLDADTIIGGFVSDNGYSDLDEAGKEAILRQTALQIQLCNAIVLPATAEYNLQLAQCYLTVYAISVDMMYYDPNNRAIIEEHAGEVGAAYNPSYKVDNNAGYPPVVESLLSQYGCNQSNTSSGFSQVPLTRA